MSHSIYIGPPIFPVFNDHLPLNDEAIAEGDLVGFVRSNNADMNFTADAAWSSNCEWYFVILPNEGIALFNTFDRRGILCRKQSYAFIKHCLRSGLLSRSVSTGSRWKKS